MLLLITGTDRTKARAAADKAMLKGVERVTVNDASSLPDLDASLSGGLTGQVGMFTPADGRAVLLDGILADDEMRARVVRALPDLAGSSDTFVMLEEKVDAATRKQLEKHAEKSERYDAPAKARDTAIFALKGALQRGDKKRLWIGLMRELAGDKPPEAVHGFLFWAAKDMCLRARGAELLRARRLVAALAELPHESRRRGTELEYALEHFVLSGACPAPRSLDP